MWHEAWTRATIGVHYVQAHLFFLLLPLDLGAQDLSQKLIGTRIKLLPGEKSHGPSAQREKVVYFRRIWVKEPVVQKKNRQKNATSTAP